MMKASGSGKYISIPIFAIPPAKHATARITIIAQLATQDTFIGKGIALPKIP